MSLFVKKLLGVGAAVALLGVLIGLYVAGWATSQPPTVAAVSAPVSSGGTQLTLETVAAIGPKYSPSHPDWVSYLVRRNGKWVHSTIFTVPANSIVHVTVYQYDGDTGLRNPFLSQVQGTVGGTMTIDGKTVERDQPRRSLAHLRGAPARGVRPAAGRPRRSQEPVRIRALRRRRPPHDQFSFRTGAKGRYRWQCFVPCAAGFLYGFGGPMQTLGYMDGFLNVV